MDSVVIVKLVSLLVYPVGLATMCLVLACLLGMLGSKTASRLTLLASVFILLIFSNSHVAKKLASSLESQYPQQAVDVLPAADAIVVLGGMIRLPIAPALYSQLGSGSDRLWYAANLYFAGKSKRVVILGGNVFTQTGVKSEAYYAAQILQQWGVPENAIRIEQGSRTTEQNANNLSKVFSEQAVGEKPLSKTILLVTSALHMPRSMQHFQKTPFNVIPASADILIQDYQSPQLLSFIPSASALQLSTVALHEYYGLWFARIKVLFT